MQSYKLQNYFLSLFLIFSVSLNAQRNPATDRKSSAAKAGTIIDINEAIYPQSAFTPTQLVLNVLMSDGTSCAVPNVTNVSVSPSQSQTDPDRFWGYFHKTTSNFPFQSGIVLTTGKAVAGGNTFNPNVIGNMVPGTGSDPDLVAATGTTQTLNDATILEFDFVPTSTQMKFRYIFASEEYTGGYPCSGYDDAFALLLKPNTPGSTYTNLAVLPAGAGPVTATNIVPADPQFSCGPINAAYFGSLEPNATNYYGITVPLTAQATVIPGQSYHIKMVIADARDTSYDSAVFLEAGSFDIGVQLVDAGGVALPATINVCDNAPVLLTASANMTGVTYQWTRNGVVIPGATAQTYTATQPGKYCVNVTLPGSTCPATACVTIVNTNSPAAQDATLTQCYVAGNAIFDLTQANATITSTPGAVISYYVNQADAQAGNANTIPNPTAYSSPGAQTVFARVANASCGKVVKITLVKAPEIVLNYKPVDKITCAVTSVTIDASDSIIPAGSLVSWSGPGIVSGGNSLAVVVNQAGNYTLTVTKTYQPGNVVCTATKTVAVSGDSTKPVTAVTADKMKVCAGERVVLKATGGPTYNWTTLGGNTDTQVVYPTTTTTYTVYAIGANGCQSLQPATVTVLVDPVPVIAGIKFEKKTLTITATNAENKPMEYSINNGLSWQDSNVFHNTNSDQLLSIVVRTKNSTCTTAISYFAFEIPNVLTPNGDNQNDYLDLSGISMYKNFAAKVSDRYGKTVWDGDKSRPIWDGRFQGKKLPTSTYWYHVVFEDPATKMPSNHTGWILIKNYE